MIENELITKMKDDIDASLLQYEQDLKEYREKLQNEFETEWSKKKFKWFFKNYRKRKLKSKILRRHRKPIFELMEDILEEMLPKTIEVSFDNLADINDVTIGDKNYFTEEELIDKINSFGCTSFMLTPNEIKQLENDLIDECYQKIIEAGGCSSSVLNEEEYEITDDYIKELGHTISHLNTLPPPVKYIKVKSKFYKQLAKMHPSINSSEVEGIRAKLTGIPIVIDDEIEDDYEPVYKETTK